MLDYLRNFLNKYEFEEDAKMSLTSCFYLVNDKKKLLEDILNTYSSNILVDYDVLANQVQLLSDCSGVHYYSCWLLVMIFMSKALKKEYEKANIPEFIFDNSMLDLKYKAKECKLVKDIWGSFVSFWEILIFRMKIFGFGHIQFEITKAEHNVNMHGYQITTDKTLIAVHIPRTEKHLYEDELDKEFSLAFDFFKDKVDMPIFFCDSWLLYPRNKEFLNKESHLYKFIDRFELYKTSETNDYSELWRLFDMEVNDDTYDKLPNNTSFRRSYIGLINNNEPMGFGWGLYFYKQKTH